MAKLIAMPLSVESILKTVLTKVYNTQCTLPVDKEVLPKIARIKQCHHRGVLGVFLRCIR